MRANRLACHRGSKHVDEIIVATNHTDYRDIAAQRDLDALVILTNDEYHTETTLAALEQRKHVLVEKPLTASVSEAEELISLAEEQQRILMVGHTFEYSPAVNELRKLVQSGELGKIYCIEAERLNLDPRRRDLSNQKKRFLDDMVTGLANIRGRLQGSVFEV